MTNMRPVKPLIVVLSAAALLMLAAVLASEPNRAEKIGEESVSRKMPPLTKEEAYVIRHQGTETPFSGRYWQHAQDGSYLCRQCGELLFTSNQKFASECGWPSFDEAVPGAVAEQPDQDGRRIEIVCAACGGHLGHVFRGERLTPKDTRFCVNSLSLAFEPAQAAGPPVEALQTAIFAGGCFWGVEDYFQKIPGVASAVSGYTGGQTENPSYQDVCTGRTGHAEAVQVTFDPAKISYEELAKTFFEIHDPTQLNRQGPDVGSQYRSAVFPLDEEQRRIAEKLIAELKASGLKPVTTVEAAAPFYPAEDYHQDYIQKTGRPQCHIRVRRFAPKP